MLATRPLTTPSLHPSPHPPCTPHQALLHDEGMTEFCIVTIPTGLAIAESERLLLALEVSRMSST